MDGICAVSVFMLEHFEHNFAYSCSLIGPLHKDCIGKETKRQIIFVGGGDGDGILVIKFTLFHQAEFRNRLSRDKTHSNPLWLCLDFNFQ